MTQPLRFSSAASLIVLGSIIAGCAAHQNRVGSMAHVTKPVGNVGLATQALAALESNNAPMAIDLADKAVAKSPTDATVRALLGNAYFAGGRFRSASRPETTTGEIGIAQEGPDSSVSRRLGDGLIGEVDRHRSIVRFESRERLGGEADIPNRLGDMRHRANAVLMRGTSRDYRTQHD